MTASTARPVQLEVALPTSAGFVPGSATVNDVVSDPVLDGRTLTWTVPAEPAERSYDVEFDVLPSLRLGATSLNATARIVGTGVVVPASAQVTVAEGLEPNDFLPEVVDAAEDFVYLTYISSPDDYDVFAIDVLENDVLVAELSNLDADLDFALWGEVQPGTPSAALTGVSDEEAIIPITDPDAAGDDSESGDDFPRLDEIVATSGLDRIAGADAGRHVERPRIGERVPQVAAPRSGPVLRPGVRRQRRGQRRPRSTAAEGDRSRHPAGVP